ncbi:MAG: hypothetical protein ABIJ92_05455 [Candidatus Aenigmatarchaeota archaeon]
MDEELTPINWANLQQYNGDQAAYYAHIGRLNTGLSHDRRYVKIGGMNMSTGDEIRIPPMGKRYVLEDFTVVPVYF